MVLDEEPARKQTFPCEASSVIHPTVKMWGTEKESHQNRRFRAGRFLAQNQSYVFRISEITTSTILSHTKSVPAAP